MVRTWEEGQGERRGRSEGSEGRKRSGGDEGRQRIGFGLFAPWPAALHTIAGHEASLFVQARIIRSIDY